jgi:hypothetical protein
MSANEYLLPPEIQHDLATLLPQLTALGYGPCCGRLGYAFGDYWVEFSRSTHSFRIVRDRGKYTVDGDRKELEALNLWASIDSREKFADRLLTWLKQATT